MKTIVYNNLKINSKEKSISQMSIYNVVCIYLEPGICGAMCCEEYWQLMSREFICHCYKNSVPP